MSIDAQAISGGFKKYPVIFISAVVSIALLGTLYFRSDLLSEQRAELEKYTTESNRHRINITNAAQLQEQLDFLIEANKAVRDRSFKAGGLAQNLQYFYRLEAETGVKYIDLRPATRDSGTPKAGKNASAPVYVPLSYMLNVKGEFGQLITFLKRLEQGAYFCRVNSALIANTGAGMTLTLNLDLLGVP